MSRSQAKRHSLTETLEILHECKPLSLIQLDWFGRDVKNELDMVDQLQLRGVHFKNANRCYRQRNTIRPILLSRPVQPAEMGGANRRTQA
jgi:hypothetical protein